MSVTTHRSPTELHSVEKAGEIYAGQFEDLPISDFEPPSYLAAPTSVFEVIWRHKWTFVTCLFLGVALTVLYFATAVREYQSSAKIFVTMGSEAAVLDPTARVRYSAPLNVQSQEREVFAVAELFRSRRIAEQIIAHFGPKVILEKQPDAVSLGERLGFLNALNLNPLRVYSIEDKAIKYFHQNLKVLAGKRSSVVTLEYVAESPEFANEVLTCLVDLVFEEHLRLHRTVGAQEFFVDRSRHAEEKVDRLDVERSQFKTGVGLASLEKQRDILLDLIGGLRVKLQEANSLRESITAGLKQRSKLMETVSSQVLLEEESDQPMSVGQALREQLLTLQIEEQDLASRYADTYPKLMQIRTQIKEVEQIIGQEQVRSGKKQGLNPVYTKIEQELATDLSRLAEYTALADVLQADLKKAEGELESLNESEVTINKLDRELEIAEDQYKVYLENLEQEIINNELEEKKISSLNLMEPPTLVRTPTSPNPPVTLGLGIVLSSLLGVGVCVARDRQRVPRQQKVPAQKVPAQKVTASEASELAGVRTSLGESHRSPR